MYPIPTATGGVRSTRKRKATSYAEHNSKYSNGDDEKPFKKPKTPKNIYPDAGDNVTDKLPKKLRKRGKTVDDEPQIDEEKRLKRFRAHPPQSYLEIKERALTQRFTILNRERCGTHEVPEEKILMAGSTGNVYEQHIKQTPPRDCPHAKKGNQCKHIIYVMLRVLKAPENIGYQLALTTSELRSLFAHAAPIPAADAKAPSSDGNRKPIDGECPICYCEFEVAEKENIVYCKAACGNNVHKDCMASWATAKQGKATCPYCRAAWEDTTFEGKVDLKGAQRNEDGYLNVASQLGISGIRDYSTYHRPWVNRTQYYRGRY